MLHIAVPRLFLVLVPAGVAALLAFSRVFGSSSMGNAGVKPFGEDAAAILAKPHTETFGPVETATFAAGCFWGVELSFQRVPGVLSTKVGYTGGFVEKPTYEDVCSGSTGHAEAIQLTFDPSIVSYSELLTVLWDRMDPTTLNAQGNDVGTQYRSAIYYHTPEQKEIAEESLRNEQEKYSQQIVTEITEASTFWDGEDYHQGYLAKGGQCKLKGDTTPIRCYG